MAADLRGPSALRSGLVAKLDADDLNDLEPCELIGEGKYGVVHKMLEKSTGQFRVVKTVERPRGWDNQRMKMEAEILQNLDHPHILRIFSWYEEGDAVNIVMEHCSGGELMKVVREGRRRGQSLPEIWAATCIRQCFEALVYLHTKGVVHKDLKSANILLLQSTKKEKLVFASRPHIVICDLGLAEVCSRGLFGTSLGCGRAKLVAGTPVTMAPEVWKGSFGPKSDVWSMGVVMFELLTGRVPFEPTTKDKAEWSQLHAKGPDWGNFEASHDALNLCERLLTVKESKRPTALEALEHAWLKQSCSNQLSSEELETLVDAVRTWKTRNPMQRALSLKMAAGCTCLKKFGALFSQFDTDNSGILDQTELVPALKSFGLDDELSHEVAESLDVNNDGSCEYVEFAAAFLSSLKEEFDELLRQEFNMLDTCRRGWLSDDQMARLLEELKPLALAHGLQLQHLDTDGDGVVSFSEFCEYFGRPGGVYTDCAIAEQEEPISGKKTSAAVKQLPMKQHIRIVKEEHVESFKSAMQASLEANLSASLEARAAHGVSPAASSGNVSASQRAATGPVATSAKSKTKQNADRIFLRMKQVESKMLAAQEKQAMQVAKTEQEVISPLASEPHVESVVERRKSKDAILNSSRSGSKLSLSSDSEQSVMPPVVDDSEHSIVRVVNLSQASHLTVSHSHDPCVGCWLTDAPFGWFSARERAAIVGI